MYCFCNPDITRFRLVITSKFLWPQWACYMRVYSLYCLSKKVGYFLWNTLWARSYMFSVHNPGKMFSEHVLGTRAFILRALWNVLGTHSFKVENGTHLGLRSMTYCVYTAQRVRSFWCALSVLIAVCVLSSAHLEHCSWYTSVHTCFGCVLNKGAICSENMVWPCSSWNCSSGNNSL